MNSAIKQHPIVDLKDKARVHFTFNGQDLYADSGKPIAAALIDNGISFSRYTEKTGQPRGLFCGIGQCNDCVVVVNGVPNVRSCVTLIEEGMEITTQQGLGKV